MSSYTSKQVTNMFKQVVATTLVALAIGSSSAVVAADTSTSIKISADIPSVQFHAVAANNTTFGNDEKMGYNTASKLLAPITQAFNLKSTSGSIKAHIVGGPVALFNGTAAHNIPLTTTIGGVTLTGTPQVVAAQNATTSAGTQSLLTIAAGTIPAAAVGVFNADFTILFEEEITGS